MKNIHLTKEYERDTSLIIEAIWARNFANSLMKVLKIEIFKEPFIIFYVTGENMQIWENGEALFWYKDCLLLKNKKGTGFMIGVIADYENILVKLRRFWQAGPTADKKILAEYVDLVNEGMMLFSLWYYSLIDERTPKNIYNLLEELRQADVFFAMSDKYIKDCLEAQGVNRGLVNLILPEELPAIPDAKILGQRANGTVSIDGKAQYFETLEQFASSNQNYLFEGLGKEIAWVKEFRGQTAFGGVVKGIVKIVKNYRQMQDVRSGEVIVSPMTTPDFLPAMKKASAFITDEGGLLCHAAITAREMKKPCVIGTKVATKVLKDGDLVEVDADKGTVKILKKA